MIIANHNGLEIRYCTDGSGDKAQAHVTMKKGQDEVHIKLDIDDLLFLHDFAGNMRIDLVRCQERIRNRQVAYKEVIDDE